MKNKGVVALGLMVALAMAVGSIAVAGAGFAGRSAPQAGAPTVVSYSGQVAVDGVPFHGTGYFKFAIVDAAGATSYWSNDGSSIAGSQPTTAVELAVDNGQLDVLLGDTALSHMTQPLDPAVFEGTERYLRLWFSADGVNYEQLSPDRRIASVPYALQAGNADTLDGRHADELVLPSGSIVMSTSADDLGLIGAGFSYTGATVQPEAWSSGAPMPTARGRLAAAEVDGIIYAIGGERDDGSVLAAVEAFNPVTDSWSTKASMPTARRNLAAAAVNGVIYAIGGNAGGSVALDTVEAYDPVANTWSTKTSMPTARYGLAAAVVDGVIYAMGGYDVDGSVLATVDAYDPVKNTWTAKAPMAEARVWLAAATADGAVYALGGNGGIYYLSTVEVYNPATNSWSRRAALPMPLENHAAVTLDGIVYALGGSTNVGTLDVLQAYDPASNAWTYKPELPSIRADLSAVAVGGRIYALGGLYNATNDVYTPQPWLYVYRKD